MAWHGDWIGAYCAHTEGLPSPEIFRLWSAISCVAGALERRVWLRARQKDTYPNLFVLLVGPPGSGKCLSPETEVLTYDGPTIRAGDVRVGTQLMGPNGRPRNVIETGRGFGPMYEIRPTKGKAWRCNGDHILSLTQSREPGKGKIKFVTVNEWLKWTPWQKSNFKLWRTGVRNFCYREDVPVDPYFLGVLIGDGDSLRREWHKSIGITTKDPEIAAMIYATAEEYNCRVNYDGDIRYSIVSDKWHDNPLLKAVQTLGMTQACGDKYIPDCYKYGSHGIRCEILAGLIDTDGYLGTGCYDFISKSFALAKDVEFLSRSLGLAAFCKKTTKRCPRPDGTYFSGTYWRVSISGNTDVIPCRIPRKKAQPRRQIKEALNTGFEIIPVGDGEWAGFTVDGDSQYLLGDFTVTHNTVAISPATELWRAAKRNGAFAFRVAPSNVTKAALIDCLDNAKQTLLGKTGGIMEYSSLLVGSSEFGVMLPSHDLEFISVLNDVFDNPKVYEERRRTLNREISIIHPQLNIIAGTQPGFLGSVMPEEAWTMGFTSRIIMVYCSSAPETELFSEDDPMDKPNGLVSGLDDMAALMGAFSWDREAQIELQAWVSQGLAPVPEHSKLQHYIPRRILHTLKLTMISAVSRSGGLHIAIEDVRRAKAWLLLAEKTMPDIFREMVGRSDGQVVQELHMFMWQIWSKDKKPIHESRLVSFLSNRVPSDKVLKVIEIAERSGIIARQAGTNNLYVPQPKHSHGTE